MSSGRQLVLDAIRRRPTDRVPWIPFVGVHGGALIGLSAADYLRSADHIVAGLMAARERYQPDALPIVFDLQLEAEVLGCALAWADDAPPSVTSHPLAGHGDCSRLPDFNLAAGRLPLVLEATRRMRAAVGEDIALYGLVCGPFTLAMHLWGNELFMALFDDPDRVQTVLDHCASIATEMAQAYRVAGCDIIAVVDPMLSQIGPDHAAAMVLPAIDRIAEAIHATGGAVSLFVCGDATRNLPVMCRSRCDNISIDENVDLAALAGLAAEHGTSVGGNIRLTVVLLLGDEIAAAADAARCLQEGGGVGHLLAPGCDLPYDVPPANVAAAGRVARDPYHREVAVAAAAGRAAATLPEHPLPDFATLPAVQVDIVTLDSAACPPCRYMVTAVAEAAGRAGFAVDWREHKITGPAGLAAMQALGVGHIPSICIDGTVAFASLIPPVDELLLRLGEAATAKGLACDPSSA